MSERFLKAIQILKSLNQPDRIINRDRINFTKLMGILNNPFNSLGRFIWQGPMVKDDFPGENRFMLIFWLESEEDWFW